MNLSEETSLHIASKNGHESVVRALVELGVDIHAKDNEYTVPFQITALSNNGRKNVD